MFKDHFRTGYSPPISITKVLLVLHTAEALKSSSQIQRRDDANSWEFGLNESTIPASEIILSPDVLDKR